jgi:hypothetical protein
VGFEVLGVLDEEVGRDDGDEGFGGEVARLFAGEGLEGCAEVVVLRVF